MIDPQHLIVKSVVFIAHDCKIVTTREQTHERERCERASVQIVTVNVWLLCCYFISVDKIKQDLKCKKCPNPQKQKRFWRLRGKNEDNAQKWCRSILHEVKRIYPVPNCARRPSKPRNKIKHSNSIITRKWHVRNGQYSVTTVRMYLLPAVQGCMWKRASS